MTIVDVDKVKLNFSSYLQIVEAGETVVIADHNKPVAELRPPSIGGGISRPFGLCAGEFVVPEDFDVPLPEELVSLFEG